MTPSPTAAHPGLPGGLAEALGAALGPAGLLLPDADLTAYDTDWTGRVRGRAAAVLRPATTSQVAHAVALCARAGVTIVPQGGHTGLSGGATPDSSGTQVVLSTQRLRRIRDVDPIGDTMTVEAGVVLAEARNAAARAGRLFPLSLASQGSCTIGGNLATNAGGSQVVRYGMARNLVLGLEVVLADGRVWDGLRALRKDNTGYDLTQVFVGSEGTLGIITAATLRLFPAAVRSATALVALPDVEAAVSLLGTLRATAGPTLTAFELISRAALEPVLSTLPQARDPFLQNHPWYGLVDLTSTGSDLTLDEAMESALSTAMAAGVVTDAAVADSAGVRARWWALREGIAEGERRTGPSLKLDIALPITALPDFVAAMPPLLSAAAPGLRIAPFGHVGDGNLHYNLGAPAGWDRAAFEAVRDQLTGLVLEEVSARGGSISAEHGIGRTKREAAARVKGDVELTLQRSIKAAWDPTGILNPGVLLPDRTVTEQD